MATITIRKAIRFGSNALVITLPKAWIDYYRVEPGDRLEVVAGDVLVVHPPSPRESDSDAAKRA